MGILLQENCRFSETATDGVSHESASVTWLWLIYSGLHLWISEEKIMAYFLNFSHQ